MSDLVVQHLCLFLYTERNEWFSCATLVIPLVLRGMSDLVVQHLSLFLYTERNECFSCEWVNLVVHYSFILRGMSDLVVQLVFVFIPLYWEEWVI